MACLVFQILLRLNSKQQIGFVYALYKNSQKYYKLKGWLQRPSGKDLGELTKTFDFVIMISAELISSK